MRPNVDSFSRVSKEELYGFVCPDCMASLESPDALLQHFESTHDGTKKLADTSESQPPGSLQTARGHLNLSAFLNCCSRELRSHLLSHLGFKRTAKREGGEDRSSAIPVGVKSNQRLQRSNGRRIIGGRSRSNCAKRLRPELAPGTLRFTLFTISHLQTELQRLRNENNSLTEEVSICRTQCSEWERKLEACCVTATECVASVAPTDDNHLVDAGVKNPEVEEILSQIQLLEQRLGQSESLRNSERSASIAELDAINSSMLEAKLRAEEAERTTSELRAALEKKSDEMTQQALTIVTLQKDLAQLRHTHQTTVDQLSQSCTAVQTLEFQMAELKLKHESEMETQMTKMQGLSHSLSSMQTERELLRTQCDDLARQITQHVATIESAEAKLTESRQQLELELEQARSQLLVSKKEADSLMERLIKSEDQVTTLRDELGRQVNEVECLNKAIFELGRENQSLQIMRERVTSRQWTKDDDAPACASCNREFSISNRRHHCRNCGGVFCHPCSSNRASTAASKDPVRVCNHCYSELTR
ncbi:hypothetical protein CRM22_005178 [Opisthorchis felineus]|uniref:FYVE-type domain-containing protein n=1 Tax=Opisthorchis felineus TaxID=147828 RepID=A0A4S2LSH1_OPIFE|nr:hypothetical protein CRM22_005178 [Opisthorchis felineus]